MVSLNYLSLTKNHIVCFVKHIVNYIHIDYFEFFGCLSIRNYCNRYIELYLSLCRVYQNFELCNGTLYF